MSPVTRLPRRPVWPGPRPAAERRRQAAGTVPPPPCCRRPSRPVCRERRLSRPISRLETVIDKLARPAAAHDADGLT